MSGPRLTNADATLRLTGALVSTAAAGTAAEDLLCAWSETERALSLASASVRGSPADSCNLVILPNALRESRVVCVFVMPASDPLLIGCCSACRVRSELHVPPDGNGSEEAERADGRFGVRRADCAGECPAGRGPAAGRSAVRHRASDRVRAQLRGMGGLGGLRTAHLCVLVSHRTRAARSAFLLFGSCFGLLIQFSTPAQSK